MISTYNRIKINMKKLIVVLLFIFITLSLNLHSGLHEYSQLAHNQYFIFNQFDGNWQTIGINVKHVSVDKSNRMWVITAEDKIQVRVNGSRISQKLPGIYKKIVVGYDGRAYGLDNLGNLYTRPGIMGAWQQINDRALLDFCVHVNGSIYVTRFDFTIWTAKVYNGPWQQIDFHLKQISVATDCRIWGINLRNMLITKPADKNSWYVLGGNMKQIDVAYDGRLWGIDSEDKIVVVEVRQGMQAKFYNVEGGESFKQVTVGLNGYLYAVKLNNYINVRKGNFKRVAGVDFSNRPCIRQGHIQSNGKPWRRLDGFFIQVVIGTSGRYFGINSSNQLWTRENQDEFSPWQKIDGWLKQIAIGVDGRLFVVNPSNQIWTKATISEVWQRIANGHIKQITVGYDGRIYGVNPGNQIWSHPAGLEGKWSQINGTMKQIAITVDGRLWGINPNNQVWSRRITAAPGQPAETEWRQVNGTSLVQLTIGTDSRIWGITAEGKVYNREGILGDWIAIDGTLKQISS